MRGAVRAYIGLGSNLGDRRGLIRAALTMLAQAPGVRVVKVASLRETQPIGPVLDQPPFLNTAAELLVRRSGHSLLRDMLAVERALGRDRLRERAQGPRTIDLDLLLLGDLVIDEPDLVVPHPRLTGRRFVLEPLAELCPRLVPPGSEHSVAALLRRGVRIIHGPE